MAQQKKKVEVEIEVEVEKGGLRDSKTSRPKDCKITIPCASGD
jgi:hypothetical protein